MTMLLLKRMNVTLDRDVIFLAEAGEEGSTNVGIDFLAREHFPEIEAEYCLAEGGNVMRKDGKTAYATVQTLEKIPRRIELAAGGVSGHGSVPLKTNPIVHLAGAVERIGEWRPAIRLNETTAAYFQRLAEISPPDVAQHYRDVLSKDPVVREAADDWLFEHEPRHSSMLRTSASPNIITGGYRFNVIPSQATATVDVRLLPDEDQEAFLAQVKALVNDPSVEVRYPEARNPSAGAGGAARFRGLHDDRSRDAARLRGRHGAVDEHRCHRHGRAAGEGYPVLRHRSRARRRGRSEGFWRAQRPGAVARERAASFCPFQLGRRNQPRGGPLKAEWLVPTCICFPWL